MHAVLQEHRPSLLRPFRTAINPYTSLVHQATICWAQQYGVVRSPADIEHFEHIQYTDLMGLAYPNAAPDVLQLIADWNTWAFALDDLLDNKCTNTDPTLLASLYTQIMNALGGANMAAETHVSIPALADIARRFRLYQSDYWLEYFRTCIANTLQAAMWEANNRTKRRIPSVQEYMHMRPHTSAVFCYLCLIELAERISLPEYVRDHAHVQRLKMLTNYAICWSNDIVSLQKELANHDVHNLVYIMHHEQRISIDDAVCIVTRMHNDVVREFQVLQQTLPVFDASTNAALTRYVDGLAFWMSANLEWSARTARYQSETMNVASLGQRATIQA